MLVSPLSDDLPAVLDAEWLAIRPGTDTALMLALGAHPAGEGLADRDFLDRCCAGFADFERYLLGAADGAAEVAGVGRGDHRPPG